MTTLVQFDQVKTNNLIQVNRLKGTSYAVMDFEYGDDFHITNFSIVIYSKNGKVLKRFNEWALDGRQSKAAQETTLHKTGKWLTPNSKGYTEVLFKFNNFILENGIGTRIPLMGWGVSRDVTSYATVMANFMYSKAPLKESDVMKIPLYDLQEMLSSDLYVTPLSLEVACGFFNLEYPGEHVGATDVEAISKVYWRLQEFLISTGRTQKYDLYQFSDEE
ncbi:hypothetical protein RND61_14635 [Streptomyces sp. TRM76323]|uniref:Uncharacterized protein n=1 Tax=Streptomyces tamarix TaxID=3078565 RepID=A0ABU3QLJ1_9ACTN|nr:hypothetical protein [Streptomyces tamarix]MDT9683299.1 hypothetical protein [Streptomyces tamarix]